MTELKVFTFADLTTPALPRPENPSPLTHLQIVSIEPRIAEVLITLKPSRDYRKRYRQYSDTKRILSDLVGWGAEQYSLRTCQAYDVIMDIVIKTLKI